MADPNTRFCPIIYVRGYAMTQSEINETSADPFCGFNLGSTVYRATPDKEKPARKFVFESPVVRLASDYDYRDVFNNGLDIIDPGWTDSIPTRSIIIYHYYDQAATLLGGDKTPDIEEFARGLSALILKVRELVCREPNNQIEAKNFKCYLIAHSMGGLVCRAFLQNPRLGSNEARRCVGKVFTYATPHNGIDMAGINVPNWLATNQLNNFNRDKMAKYLKLENIYKKTDRVDWLPEESFPSEKFFCMIGSNRADYEVAMGASRTFAGHGSDGLVRLENASVWGVDARGKFSAPSATAYAYRSHSGYFGIVNSEESYQNLVRFLFGDIRADVWLDIDAVRLPKDVQKAVDEGKKINALYQFEILASPRGKQWYLSRRTAEEDSAACRSHQDLGEPSKKTVYLTTVFLSLRQRVDPNRPSLACSATLGVRAPDYEVDLKFWPNQHYEGGYLFRDSVVIEIFPPSAENAEWQLVYDWQTDNLGQAATKLDTKVLESGKLETSIPFGDEKSPGISGKLRFILSMWNT